MELNWAVPDAKLPKSAIKVMLNLSQIALDALVRGGTLDIGAERTGGNVEIVARATAEKLEAQAPDTQKFAQIVCESVDYAQRLSIAEQLWQVIVADGKQRPEEHRALHEIEAQLGIQAADRPAR